MSINKTFFAVLIESKTKARKWARSYCLGNTVAVFNCKSDAQNYALRWNSRGEINAKVEEVRLVRVGT